MRTLAMTLLLFSTAFMPVAAEAQSDSPTPMSGHMTHHRAMSSSKHGDASMQQFKTEADARRICANGDVAWMNTRNDALHFPGDTYYGKTKHGAYVCTKNQ